jgi:hypothetical protein
MMLDMDRGGLGPEADARTGEVYGVMFEVGGDDSVITFVALADDTTSMYVSTGAAIIGAGPHESVARANRHLLDVVESHLAEIPPSDQTALPADGTWTFRALTNHGRRAVDVSKVDLRPGHPLWDVYRAAHGLITQIRILDETRPPWPDR